MSAENRTITFDEALQALDACVAERGEDYLYPEEGKIDKICQYWWGPDRAESLPEGPACIVGLALSKLGASDEFIRDLALINAQTVLSQLAAGKRWLIDPDVVGLMRAVQIQQDTGKPWGYAVRQAAADHYASTVGL